ncbi:MAG: Fic family protein [Patescibacteria group bacterium]
MMHAQIIQHITQPFKNKAQSDSFLASFILVPANLTILDQDLRQLDQELANYERAFLNPEIEQNLLSKNELLASFAISKAENSSLTLMEAQQVYKLVLSQLELNFIGDKLRAKKKLTYKDYEKLEFFNIAKTFRYVSSLEIKLEQLDEKFILDLHARLTRGLDIFADYLSGFDVYKAGAWRDNDQIRVGGYQPALHEDVPSLVGQLLTWVKEGLEPSKMGVFHTALYAVHPFNNGNKRVCRILEHLLWRLAGFNQQNLYSLSYYYHQQKDRYYKHLLNSLKKRHLNYFTNLTLEAGVLSILGVLKTSIESLRSRAVKQGDLGEKEQQIIKWLVKRKELNFKSLTRKTRGKMARQTLATYLKKLVEEGWLRKRASGKNVFYSLDLDLREEGLYQQWLGLVLEKLSFVPDEYRLVV